MTSTSGNDGIVDDHRHLRRHRDLDIAAVDVQNRVSQASAACRPRSSTSASRSQKVSSNFVLAAGVFAENGEYDSLFMSNYLDVFVKDALKRVPGVGDVIIFGERKYAMRLWLDPGPPGGARPHRRRRRRGAARAERAGGGRQVGQPPAPAGQTLPDQRARRRPADRGRRSSRTSSSSAAATARSSGSRTSAAPSSAPRTTPPACASTAATRSASACAAPDANALDVYRDVDARARSAVERVFPPGLKYESRSTPRRSSPNRSARCS